MEDTQMNLITSHSLPGSYDVDISIEQLGDDQHVISIKVFHNEMTRIILDDFVCGAVKPKVRVTAAKAPALPCFMILDENADKDDFILKFAFDPDSEQAMYLLLLLSYRR